MSLATAASGIVQNGLRCRFGQLELCAHFLQARRERLNLFLQPRNGSSLFVYCLVLFKKLVQQYRIHGFVAYRVGLAIVIASRAEAALR